MLRTSVDNNESLSYLWTLPIQQQTMEKYSCGEQKPALEKALLNNNNQKLQNIF